MSSIVETTSGVLDSLTGHDEMAVAQHFGRPVIDLLESDSTMYARALVFVLKRRDGLSDDDARNAALDMALRDVTEYFDEDEAEAGASDEESGKDELASETALEPQPVTSLTSVS